MLNATHHGVVPDCDRRGNPFTDNTTALGNLLAKAMADEEEVFFPPGEPDAKGRRMVYGVRGTVHVEAPVGLYLRGAKGALIAHVPPADFRGPLLHLGVAGAAYAGGDVDIEQLRFLGFHGRTTDTLWLDHIKVVDLRRVRVEDGDHAVRLDYIMEGSFTRLRAKQRVHAGQGGACIHIGPKTSTTMDFLQCKVEGKGHGVQQQGGISVFLSCTFQSCGGSGIMNHLGSITVRDCHFEGNEGIAFVCTGQRQDRRAPARIVIRDTKLLGRKEELGPTAAAMRLGYVDALVDRVNYSRAQLLLDGPTEADVGADADLCSIVVLNSKGPINDPVGVVQVPFGNWRVGRDF